MYRTKNGGDSWERIEKGLSSRFGFPLGLDPKSKTLYAIPQESDEYRMAPGGDLRVYRSTNGGDSWELLSKGLPKSAYIGVLRGALAVEGSNLIFGTTAGTLHTSSDGGESWKTLPYTLPRILCVAPCPE